MYNVRNGNYKFTSDSADEWNRFVVHFTPPVQIAMQNSSCDEKGVISVIQPGTANWNYIITNANNVTVATGVLNQSSPVNVSADAGTYTIQLVDNNNYTVTKVIQVSGAPVAIASFNAPANASAQTTVSFTSTSQNAVQFTWYFSDGGIVSGVSDATYTFNAPGTYTVMLEITNAAGCTSSITKTIIITGSATAIQNINGNGEIDMWSYANRVYVDFSQLSNVNATIKIFNILGQEICTDRFANNALYEKQIDNIDAAYIIVSVKNDDKITTKKLFVVNTK
jgi:PKD repeat protein